MDDLLEGVQCDRAAATDAIDSWLLQRFAEAIPKSLNVADSKPFHVLEPRSRLQVDGVPTEKSTTTGRWSEALLASLSLAAWADSMAIGPRA